MDQSKFPIKRILGIDGLRAFAVLAVIAYHLDHAFLPGGFAGVDVFFVISGYVVCSSLLKDSASPFLPFIGAFYIRRLLRIYPALIVLLLCGGLLSTLFIPDSFLSTNNQPIGLWAFFGLSNFALIWFNNSYFAVTNDYNPYAHTWSLGVEEQFYFFFPLILFWLLRARPFSVFMRQIMKCLLPALLLASLCYSIKETSSHHDWAYFLLPSRFWELAAGAVLCLMHHNRRWLLTSPAQAAGVTSMGLGILILSFVFIEPIHFPFPLAIPPVVGTVFCIAGVVSASATGPNRILTLMPIVWIGRISYSLYLWHWLVIVLLRWTIGVESLLFQFLALLFTFVFATASYYFIEQSIFLPHSAAQKRRLIAIASCVCLIFSTRYIYVHISSGSRFQNLIGLSTVTRNRQDWYPHLNSMTGLMSKTPAKHWSTRQIFCVGDSHAGAYAGMLRMLETKDGVTVSIDSLGGQPTASLVYPLSPTCAEHEAKALEFLKRVGHSGDVVLLADLRVTRLCDGWGAVNPPIITESGRELAVKQAKEFVSQLIDLKLHVIVDAPPPIFPAPPFRGSDWFNRMNPVNRPGYTISNDFFFQHRAPAMQSIHELQLSFPNVQVWDPLPVLRLGSICSAFEGSPLNGKPLFFDGDHLSDYGGRKLYPSFKAILEKLWN